MILVAGGTGRLGTQIVELLRRRDLEVRVLTRDRSHASRLVQIGAEVVEGDVGDRAAVRRAVEGVQTVVSAIHGFAGPRGVSPATVDRDGNHNLVQAAGDAGVENVVLLSVEAAAPDHPMDLMRMKYAAEQDLKASGMTWTIIRPTAYMETWCEVLGRPLLQTGATNIFGHGQNPVNFVAASDVARLVELAVVDPGLRRETIGAYGPENLTTRQFVDIFQSVASASGSVSHIPRAAMRMAAVLMPVINPAIGRQIRAGLVMDTAPMGRNDSEFRSRYPSIPVTTLADVVKRDFVGSAVATELAAAS
jgi:NADH dehydrogenase